MPGQSISNRVVNSWPGDPGRERERGRERGRGRERERSWRSRLESVGAFSFRRRLFLDASLINIKQASRARARSRIHAGETLPVLFYSGTLSRLLCPPVPLRCPPSVFLTPLRPTATICRSLSMHRRYRQARAVTRAPRRFALGDARKPSLAPATSTTPATRSSSVVASLFVSPSAGWFARDHRLTGVIFALARGGHSTRPRKTARIQAERGAQQRSARAFLRAYVRSLEDAGGKEITVACHRAVPVAIGVVPASHTPPPLFFFVFFFFFVHSFIVPVPLLLLLLLSLRRPLLPLGRVLRYSVARRCRLVTRVCIHFEPRPGTRFCPGFSLPSVRLD